MAKVWKAEAYNVRSDERKFVFGTREFLKSANLKAIEDEEHEVPDSEVDENGQYRPSE